VAKVRAAGFRLADAQSVVARQTGFASWPNLARHVTELRGLEGEWQFASLEVEGAAMPVGGAKILIDGDRFRTESGETVYDGVFVIDVEATPHRIDIDFVEGPEAGNRCEGIYRLDGDDLVICLGLTGSTRPATFTAPRGSGHAFERLRRASAARPANVTGGTPQPQPEPIAPVADPSAFDAPLPPAHRRLEGEWSAVELVMNGKALPAAHLAYGSRTMIGNEVKVVFGGQTMVHARVRIDDRVTPIAVDYLNLDGKRAGTVSYGIMEWHDSDVRFLMAPPGHARPQSFATPPRASTLSTWRPHPRG
ncbi:MAG: TIGR03067 domain-containing protein, partial [Kofleriaceae bacterium]